MFYRIIITFTTNTAFSWSFSCFSFRNHCQTNSICYIQFSNFGALKRQFKPFIIIGKMRINSGVIGIR